MFVINSGLARNKYVTGNSLSKLHKYSTQLAAHSQDTNTGTRRSKREDGDYERRWEDGDLPFPTLKSMYYYWPLIILIYFNRTSVRENRHCT